MTFLLHPVVCCSMLPIRCDCHLHKQREWERAWKGSGSLSCKESVGTLGATHETLSSWSFSFATSTTSCERWKCDVQDITALTISLFGYRDTYGWDQLGNPRTVTMIVLPFLIFLYFLILSFLLLECFATNFEVDLIILAFLLWLNGIFLDTNYVIKKVFWETFKYF